MPHDYQDDIDAISRVDSVVTILDVVCRTTGMGFAAVARVTDDRWITCALQDQIAGTITSGTTKSSTAKSSTAKSSTTKSNAATSGTHR